MIYLDNSATTRTMGVAAEAAKKYMTEEFFNPAAAYSPAVREERAVNGARKTIGSAINAGPDRDNIHLRRHREQQYGNTRIP